MVVGGACAHGRTLQAPGVGSTARGPFAKLSAPSYHRYTPALTNAPATQLRALRMSLLMLKAGCCSGPACKECVMDMLAGMPEWLVWCTAGGAGALALAALAGLLEAALQLAAD